MAKGLYINKSDEKEIVFVSEITVEGDVIYTEALHPVGAHCIDSKAFLDVYKKVHKVEFAETE